MRIPKLSAPLVKDIRTGEGILEWVLAALGVAVAVAGDLSVSKTGLYLTVLAVSKSVRRLLLKVVAAQSQLGIGPPLTPPVLDEATGDVDAALASINAAQVAAARVRAQLGTPAEQLKAGLAPSDPQLPVPPVPPVAA